MPTKAQIAAAKADVKAQRARRTKPPVPEMAKPAAADIDSMAFDLGGFELPSWKRVLCGLVLGVLGAGTVGYGIGMLMAYALAGIATLTASAGLAFCLSVLVWVIGIYASWKIGGYVGGKIFASVVLPEGLASRSIESVSNAAADVKGWFASKPIVQRAKAASESFTGAHTAAA